LFDLEAAAKRLHGTAAVDFYCQGCLLPVRVIFNHHPDDRGEWWEVKAVLETWPEEGVT
jgi:hypothetical protein